MALHRSEPSKSPIASPSYYEHDPLSLQACRRPTSLACIDLATNRRWTYCELDAAVQRAAVHLSSRESITAGDRVAVVSPNSVCVVVLHQALMRLGAIFVPLNWRLAAPELSKLIWDCTPKVLYYCSQSATADHRLGSDELLLLPSGCRKLGFDSFITAVQTDTIGIDATLTALTAGNIALTPPPTPPTEEDTTLPLPLPLPTTTSVIVYTSGTTGRPKGVCLTPQNLLATGLNFCIKASVDSSSVFLVDVPIFHMIGLAICVGAPLLRGATFAMSPRFDPVLTNERIADLGVTHFFCVPQMADAMAKAGNFDARRARWDGLKAVFTGGAPNPAERVLWWLEKGVKMCDGYGTTETGSVFTMPLGDEGVIRRKAGSVGRAGPMNRAALLDERGFEVKDGEEGEIAIEGPSVAKGYWDGSSSTFFSSSDRAGRAEENTSFSSSPSSSASAAVDYLLPREGKEGWVRTGDIARRDEDGFVFIVDRRKDVFISGGENIYPSEVEAALVRHPAVREAAVVGVPDAQWGEAGFAFVVLGSMELLRSAQGEEGKDVGLIVGDASYSTVEEKLAAHLRGLIGRYKIPKKFRVVDGLPRTASGKIRKHVLRHQAMVDG